MMPGIPQALESRRRGAGISHLRREPGEAGRGQPLQPRIQDGRRCPGELWRQVRTQEGLAEAAVAVGNGPLRDGNIQELESVELILIVIVIAVVIVIVTAIPHLVIIHPRA